MNSFTALSNITNMFLLYIFHIRFMKQLLLLDSQVGVFLLIMDSSAFWLILNYSDLSVTIKQNLMKYASGKTVHTSVGV